MHSSLAVTKKIYIASYTRYLMADRAWISALDAASQLVPNVVGHGYWRLGSPRSRIRRLYLERDRALRRLMLARAKLEAAKARANERPDETGSRLFLIGR
jgi:hypothetical protein